MRLEDLNRDPGYVYWVPVPGFNKYELSNQGSLRRVSDKMLISKMWTPSGRCRVTLTNDDGKRETLYFDRVVAKTFFDIEDDTTFEMLFNDGNRANFSLYNVRLYDLKKKSTMVKVIETGRVYRSVEDCARAIGGTKYGIYACLEGRRNTYKGYHFDKV